MNISVTDARGLFTKMLVDVYRERTRPTSFLRSFFPTKETSTKEISIEVERGTEKVAVDVHRGTEGNRNRFSKSTEKIFIPPYYREFFDATDLDLYDRLFGSTSDINDAVFMSFMESVADKLGMLQDKIERAYELQCSQVLIDGIVQLNASGINIDFKRKADSKVDLGSSNYWADSGVDPATSLETAGNFIRQVGKAQGGFINVIAGSEALSDLISNEKVQNRGKIYNYALDMLNPPQRDSVGATFHGEMSAGSYRARIWSYPEFYDNAAGESTPYIDPKKIVVLPDNPRFKLVFAAVPQLLTTGGSLPKKGAYLIGNYVDERHTSHIFDIKSAGIAVPVAVDQAWTGKVVAG